MIQKLHRKKFFFNYKKKLLLSLTVMMAFSASHATTWYVNDASLINDVYTTAVGNDGNPGTAAAPFATFQFAINTAAAGDTIYVDAGTYPSANIDITKASLTLRGAKFGIPAGPAAVPANRGTGETVIEAGIYFGASLDNITVDGFTFSVGTNPWGITARGLNSVIINNIVTGIATPAVIQTGIATRANAPLRVHSYLISHNNVSGFRIGVYMDGNLENPSEISYNYVTACSTQGFTFTASNGHHIKANVSENNAQGMLFTKGANLVEQNTITGNLQIGIRLAAAPVLSGNLIVNNFFINNGSGITLTSDDAGAVNNAANYNSFTGNILNIVSTHSASFNAQCNWYNTTVGAIIAAQISGNVNFNPFLTNGTDTDPVDGFQPSGNCIVLPVILTDFSATVKNYDVLLKWNTASEVNSSHFDVERSIDNVHFSTLGNITAKGFSDVPVNYNFTDNKAVNFDRPTYYRLAMIDRDGTKKYSKILSVTLKTSGSYVQDIYPNPVKAGNKIQVNFISKSSQTVNISFIGSTGQQLNRLAFRAVKGSNLFEIAVPAETAAGLNFILIKSPDIITQFPVYIR